jgi:hypothetical protein
MGNLTSAKGNRQLNTIAFLNKAPDVLYFEVHIMRIGARANLHFLDGARSRALFGIVGLLLQRVAILVEVGDAAYRRRRVGRHLDQVQSLRFGHADGFAQPQDADLGAVNVDDADFRGADLLVDLDCRFSGWRGSEISTNNAPPAAIAAS